MTQDYFRYKRMGKRWRKPRGLQNKLRLKKGGSGKLPSIGYSADSTTRNLVKFRDAFYKPVIINNENELDKIKENEIAILSGAVGAKKALLIEKKAAEKNITFLYKKRFHNAEITKNLIQKRKEEKKAAEKKKEHKKDEHKKKENKEDKKTAETVENKTAEKESNDKK